MIRYEAKRAVAGTSYGTLARILSNVKMYADLLIICQLLFIYLRFKHAYALMFGKRVSKADRRFPRFRDGAYESTDVIFFVLSLRPTS